MATWQMSVALPSNNIEGPKAYGCRESTLRKYKA
jgi:hypothetical protein